MKVFFKKCSKVAGIFILTGIVLILIGYGTDEAGIRNLSNYSVAFIKESDMKEWGFWKFNKEDNTTSAGMSEAIYNGDTKKNESFQQSSTKNKDKIKALNLDISYGSVSIKAGEDFNITMVGEDTDYVIENKIEDGIWTIKDNKADNDSFISIYGFQLSFTDKSATFSYHKAPDIEITIPKDYYFEDVDITLNAGSLEAENLLSERAGIKVWAGRGVIDGLKVSEKSSFSVGTGELIMNNIALNNANFDCGVGNLSALGSINGENYVVCGIGNVTLSTKGNYTDYNYALKCGVGSIAINGESYSGINNKNQVNNNAPDFFDLECGIGKITLNTSPSN